MIQGQNKAKFDHTAKHFGFDSETGNRLYITQEKFIWEVDEDGIINYSGELIKEEK